MKKPISTLVPWFGSNRSLAENVGRALDGCRWVGVPFAGGMCELRHINARTLLVSDLHRHVINLAMVVGDEQYAPMLRERLGSAAFHPALLLACQRACIAREQRSPTEELPKDYHWAFEYFVCAWMSRNGTAGTDGEFNSGLSVRWDAGGGDSATRFRSAVESLREWQQVMRRCTFVVLDVFAFLKKVKDAKGHGLYLDPPFPEVGDGYKHTFTRQQHCDLATLLSYYFETRVVCRFYNHPLIRELYPETEWTWHHLAGGKTQTNAKAPEVLLVRN